MVVTDIARSGTALAIGSLASNKPTFMLIGSGSGTELAGMSGLIAVTGSPAAFTSTDITIAREVTWQSNWSPGLMSGLSLREFTNNTGSGNVEAWGIFNLGDIVNFDGTNELRIEIKYTVI